MSATNVQLNDRQRWVLGKMRQSSTVWCHATDFACATHPVEAVRATFRQLERKGLAVVETRQGIVYARATLWND